MINMSKKQNIYKGFYDWSNNDEFSHHYACWAINHMGWAKMKKFNKKLAKRRLKQKMRKELEKELKNDEVRGDK